MFKNVSRLFLIIFSFFLLPTAASANTFVSGTISSNQTWVTASSTYVVTGSITINPGVTLTINPGVVVKFASSIYSITNNGTLNAQGTATNTIYFTSYQDDTIAGDTNGNGTSTGSAGNWRAIQTNAGATTTIANAELRFSTYGFYNFGGIVSLATTTATTSSQYGLLHEKGTTTVATSFFGNNGNYGIYIGGPGSGSLTVSSSTITKNSALNVIGLYARGTAALTLTNNSFATNTNAFELDYIDGGPISFTHSGNKAWGNPVNGISVSNGSSFNANKTWTSDTIPYVIRNGFTIPSGKTLTVNPGAVVKFYDSGSNLYVSGTLSVEGSTSSPVYFTSLRDDSVGGDTNGNGSANVPAGGDWERITTPSNGTSTIDHTIIRYGGSNSSWGMVFGNGGTMTITNSEIASSSYNGVYHNGSGNFDTMNISYSDIHDNGTSTGTYYGISHLTGTTTIDHSTIRNHRAYGIHAAAGTGNLYLTNSTSSNNTKGAVLIDLSKNLNFTHYNNVATGTGKGGIVIYSSPGKAQTWWGDPLLPYIISTTTGSVTVNTYGVTLASTTPAAVFKFEGATAGITVGAGGSFTIDSSATNLKTYFTSIKDDKVGGDTNGDKSSTTPAAGDWDRIAVLSTANGTLKYAVVRYGGNTTSVGSVSNSGGTLTLENSEIATSSSRGVSNSSGTLTVLACDIHNNTYGIDISGGTASIGSSNIHGNTSYGINNTSAATTTAKYNFFGTSTGPYNATYHATGTGDTVSNKVDFVPWLTAMHYLYMKTGTIVGSVHSMQIRYVATSTATSTKSAWYPAVATWNAQGVAIGGGVNISTSTVASTSDLWVYDIASSTGASLPFTAQYVPDHFFDSSKNDSIQFNDYYMASTTAQQKQNVATHELGHALGLWHSYIGNIMNPYSTTQTALGTQDISDYNYVW